MSDERPVLPWLDQGSDASADVRAVLDSAKSDGLSAAQVDALAKKVLALSAGATVAASIAPAASSGSLSLGAKITAAALVLAVGGAGVWTVRARTKPAEPPQHSTTPVAHTRTPERPRTIDTTPIVQADAGAAIAMQGSHDAAVSPARDPAPTARANTQRSARTIETSHTINTAVNSLPIASPQRADAGALTVATAPAVDPADDAGLLHRAAAALRSGATSEAIALLDRHRQLFASSVLSEERERIAIEALVRAGRREQAQREAARFRQMFPGSAQQPRIDALVRSDEQR